MGVEFDEKIEILIIVVPVDVRLLIHALVQLLQYQWEQLPLPPNFGPSTSMGWGCQ